MLWSYFSAVFLVKHKQTHMRFALKKMNKQLMLHRNQVQFERYVRLLTSVIYDAFVEEMFFSENLVPLWMEERRVQADIVVWRSISLRYFLIFA